MHFPLVWLLVLRHRNSSGRFEADDVTKAIECVLSVPPEPDITLPSVGDEVVKETTLKVGSYSLAAGQRADPSLVRCVMAAENNAFDSKPGVVYFWE